MANRVRLAPDGTKVRATGRIEKIKGRYREVIVWLDEDGNQWDPCDLVRDQPVKSRAYVGGSKRARGADKARKVKGLTSETCDDRRKLAPAFEILTPQDRERIVERVKSKPRPGKPGVSARDMKDLKAAVSVIEESDRRESMRIAAAAMKNACR